MKLVLELGLSLVLATILALVWARRRTVARQRLEQIDSGRCCVACDALDTVINGDSARCQRCGHRWSIGAFRGARVSANEVATITRPKLDD